MSYPLRPAQSAGRPLIQTIRLPRAGAAAGGTAGDGGGGGVPPADIFLGWGSPGVPFIADLSADGSNAPGTPFPATLALAPGGESQSIGPASGITGAVSFAALLAGLTMDAEPTWAIEWTGADPSTATWIACGPILSVVLNEPVVPGLHTVTATYLGTDYGPITLEVSA